MIEEAFTFDDVLLVPRYSEVLPNDADLRTRLSRGIDLNVPIVSAAMDTITEGAFATALALQGGMGFIHKNMSITRQAQQVTLVKKFESGVIRNPITVEPETSVAEALKLTASYNISGVPVVDGNTVAGIVTHRDLRFETRMDAPVREIMTPRNKLVTVGENATQDEVIHLFHKYKIEKILVVDDDFQLKGMLTVKDIQKNKDYPNACKDEHGSLRVGAAVGVGSDTAERVAALIEAGVDVIAIDTAHGHSRGVLQQLRWIKSHYPDLPTLAGNVATGEGALALVKEGADGIKVGMGPGSICTTRVISGVGVPQISAIMDVVRAIKQYDIPVIADGGIRYSGDVAKAIAAGADAVMIGSLFAGTEEAPGEVELYQGRSYKSYRGMGSLNAMSQNYSSRDRYFQEAEADVGKLVPEGIEGRVPYKGSLAGVIHQLLGGLRSSMGYTGCTDIKQMRHDTRFIRVTAAGVRESHVHDVGITKEAPNYQVRQ